MKKVTIDELIRIVADEFLEEMIDGAFETFDEMKRLYDWTSKDIRAEVEAIIMSAETDWEMMDDSDIYRFENGGSVEDVTYRWFIGKVYKLLPR